MTSYRETVVDLINKIAKSNKVIIYGAKQMAKEMIPVCEAVISRDKISVVVTQSEGGNLEGYEVLSIKDIDIDNRDIILVAMGECYFDEIRQMPQIKKADCVIYLSYGIIREAKLYTLQNVIRKLGIDFRLFNQIEKYEILGQMQYEKANDITTKTWELATEETARYVIENMRNAKIFLSCNEYHSWLKGVIKDNQTDKGINMEFGVAGGRSLRTFAGDKINIFFGFDSFEGLPENWMPEFEKGTFKMEKLPWVSENVELIKGWFDDTLPIFVTRDDIVGRKADFIHIDCDLYSSAKSVFDNVTQFIRKGTIIAFDEYFNYPGWQMDEFKAFHEFVEINNIQYEYLAYVNKSTQVCVRIL